MELLKIFIMGAVFTVVLAVEADPLLPTPLPIESDKNETETTTEQPKSMLEKENVTKIEDSKQGRAMDISSDMHSFANFLNGNNSTNIKTDDKKSSKNYISTDLSDVSMDNDDMDLEFSSNPVEKENSSSVNVYGETRVVNKPHLLASEKSFMPLLVPSISNAKDVIETSCIDSGKIFKIGEKMEKGCDETCKCVAGGLFSCESRCKSPFFRRGRKIDDPLCTEQPVEDPCCAILVCAADSQNEMCVSGNKTYSIGEKFNEGCERTCRCEKKGSISCQPRCPKIEHRDDCVNITSSTDSCCMIQLCDVTRDNEDYVTATSKTVEPVTENMEINTQKPMVTSTKEFRTLNNTTSKSVIPPEPTTLKFDIPVLQYKNDEPISMINILHNGTVEITLNFENTTDTPIYLEISKDGMNWKNVHLNKNLLMGLEEGGDFLIRSKNTNRIHPISIPKHSESKPSITGCMHKGRHRSIDEEFHMGCDELCVCGEDGKVVCAPLKCPSSVGLDVLDSSCIQWSPDPPDFEPKYPMCCPPAMKCVSNGSCTYKDQTIPNWFQVPVELTGCEQQCFCEKGTIECQGICAPLTALPPPNLHCAPNEHPAPKHIPGDTCCKEWACVSGGNIKQSSKNMTDDKDRLKYSHKHGNTNKSNPVPPPIFVTLPPDIHKAIEDKFGTHLFDDGNKNVNSKPMSSDNTKPYFTPHSVRPSKGDNVDNTKNYEYPGPFADPNHKPQPPINDLGPFPFIKKHKDKQIYNHQPEDTFGITHHTNDVVNKHKDIPKKAPQENNTAPIDHDDFPINDPYLTGSRLHLPFNQNNVGPGFFNPATSKNPAHFINALHHANVNPQIPQPPGNGLFHNGVPIGNQVPQGPDTIHVYTDGSPIHIEQLLQHIQQADPNLGPYIPYVTQSQQPIIPNHRPQANNSNASNNLPSGGGVFPNGQFGNTFGGNDAELQITNLEAISPTTLKLAFTIPPVMVGLQGRVKVHYTSDNDPSTWLEQEFAPPNDILATQQFEFQLSSLQPDTHYHIQAIIFLRQLGYERKSKIYSVRTPPSQEKTTLPPSIPIEPNLSVGQVQPTTASISWRPFTQEELVFIDGIQLRYREIGASVFSGTPLIHRAVTSYLLESLKPNTSYEVGIFFIPFLNQQTELQSSNMVNFETPPEVDMYNWNVDIDVKDVSPWDLTVVWSGIPRPTEKYVNVFRTVWRAETAQNNTSSFTLPSREVPSQTVIKGLAPGTRYRIWVELYLTNGHVKTSNVKDVMTKPGKPAPEAAPAHEGKLLEAHRGDYYNSLVVVAIIAALGAMCSLVLLLILVRRHRTASAPICGPTPTGRSNPALPPYDSPTYKLDLHQETMDL